MFIDLIERRRDRERNINVRNISWLPPVHAPTGHQIHDLCRCRDQELNPQLFGVQYNIQLTELPSQGKSYFYKRVNDLELLCFIL